MNRRGIAAAGVCAAIALLAAWLFWTGERATGNGERGAESGEREKFRFEALRLDSGAIDPSQAEFGMRLFQNPSVGRSKHRRCAACHDLTMGGTDAKEHGGVVTRSVVNAAWRKSYLHDASLSSLHDVVKLMIEDPRFGHGGSIDAAAGRVASGKILGGAFVHLYPGKADGEHLVEALVQYLGTLRSEPGRFDRFLAGDAAALTAEEKRGMDVFARAGCGSCHGGPTLGDGKTRPLRGSAARKAFAMPGGRTGTLQEAISAMPGAPAGEEDKAALESFVKLL